jgi:hypothetical protein
MKTLILSSVLGSTRVIGQAAPPPAQRVCLAVRPKNANIHGRSAVIRGIPVETLAQAARPVDDDDWGSDRQVEAENLFFDAVCRELSNEQIIELEEPIRTETDMA